ncbi:MAG: peptide-methionine (S)-S-oxide reductase MsrA [Gemmatimonadaceae bacterium]
MSRLTLRGVAALALALPLATVAARRGAHSPEVALPPPAVEAAPLSDGVAPAKEQTAVLAGGCFWGMEGVFEHVKGVTSVVSGYAGGAADSAQYETVSTGETGHAESVRITFDPSQVSYGQLLQLFFSVAHDPTERNRQGPDVGPQYRSAIFYANEEQARVARAYVDQLTSAKAFPRPIVTEIAPLRAFYPAEAYHQDYMARHPNEPYILINDRPKVAHLEKRFPQLYRTETTAAR